LRDDKTAISYNRPSDVQGGPKTGTIGQWRRWLECVVQQQGGHIEHLMQKLQDVTVALDNN